MARGEIYLPLSVDFCSNPRLLRAGERAGWLYIAAALLSKRVMSDGFIEEVQLPTLGLKGVRARADALVREGLWERVNGGYQIVGYLDRNPSRDQILEDRKAEAERKRQARKSGRSPNGVRPDTQRTSVGVREPETETETRQDKTPGSRRSGNSRNAGPQAVDNEGADAVGVDPWGVMGNGVDRVREILAEPDPPADVVNGALAEARDHIAHPRADA